MTALNLTIDDGIALVVLDTPGAPVNLISQPVKDEFAALIDRFEQAWTQGSMRGQGRIDDVMCHRIMFGRKRNHLGAFVPWWFSFRQFTVLA